MLATGIPRFRLPREVREKEIEAIKNMGIDIRTGITVGRDVNFAYLRERGYYAFFLSIGTQKNNKLKIPGEELNGVVDCMSLLLTLNLMVDSFVGANIIIIGDGNTAIDSARAAIRRNKGTVKILSWTIPEELTAAEEEVREALQEGISIEYCTAPVEILGEAGKVTGIRCQRTELTDAIMSNGRHLPRRIPNTDFVIDADHVIVAIGQSPNASQLNIEELEIDDRSGVIKVNPLTLETSIPGIFAGGDCITGPNNVVEAMASGIRAAESIDRYCQGYDLETERSLEPLKPVEIDIATKEIMPYKRANMPSIRLQKRINSFEETTTGLPPEKAQKEAQRCLNCALCSQCMECARMCEQDAVFHSDYIKHLEIKTQAIFRFPHGDLRSDTHDNFVTAEGINTVLPNDNDALSDKLAKAMAKAMETATEIEPKKEYANQIPDLIETGANLDSYNWASKQSGDRDKRIGVFLCRCGDSISTAIDFKAVTRKLSNIPNVSYVEEINQACTSTEAEYIARQVSEWKLDRIVLAACRCCNLEQVCYSCTDRRIKCQQYLNQCLLPSHNAMVEYVNIREQCAWVHRDSPRNATRKAVQIISSGVNRIRIAPSISLERSAILPKVLIIGDGIAMITAAGALASHGYQVELLSNHNQKQNEFEPDDSDSTMHEQLHHDNITIKPLPDTAKLYGSPGNYEAALEYNSQVERIKTGAVLLDMNDESSGILSTMFDSGLIHRIISRANDSAVLTSTDSQLFQEITIKETCGIFLLLPAHTTSQNDGRQRGLAMAARIANYLEQASISPRSTAAYIDSKLCRGCGNCASICPYVEMKERENGIVYACIDKSLCLGCGACVTSCAVGAITQPLQSDRQITATLRSMLQTSQVPSEVY